MSLIGDTANLGNPQRLVISNDLSVLEYKPAGLT